VSHDLNAVERLCDKLISLENAEIRAQEEPDAVIAEYRRNQEPAKRLVNDRLRRNEREYLIEK
jgi:ABC-type polysaccharide/polyol phosphate transport system ATPase subunit